MNILGEIINSRYRIDSFIREDAVNSFYHGTDLYQKDESLVVIFLKNSAISTRIEDVIRFKNEVHAVSQVEHKNIITIFDVGDFIEFHYLAIENIEDRNLSDVIRNEKISLDRCINIITQVCSGLDHLHSRDIIHKGIHPSAILISKGRMLLSGFGLSSIRKFDETVDTEDLMDAFKYMSPEQCRVLHRDVDERSDLYSIGVLFYRLLTGMDPFGGKNINSVIHKQVAMNPIIPSELNPEIPEVLDRIVMKLLDKDPEGRYQSAGGLLADLRKYSEGQSDFILGLNDRFTRLNFRTRFIGREREFSDLVDLYGRIDGGRGGVCFITGEAGSGKTRLVEELRRYIYSRGGFLVEGKCQAQGYKVPYEPFREALNECLNIFHRLSEVDKERITRELRNEFFNFGEILIKLNPAIKEILGDCPPPLVPLMPERESQRFHMVIARFFRKLSELSRRLVIVIEDLQWADEGTLKLLPRLLDSISQYPLAVVCSYREDEVRDNHGIMRIRASLADGGAPVEEIQLDLFDYPRMNKLISGLLMEAEKQTIPLSKLIQEKSGGNPFFAIEILKQLIDEKALRYGEGRWHFEQRLADMITISDTLVDIILNRILKLDESEMTVLSYASAIGVKFKMELLFAISELAETEVVRIVDHAVGLKLLVSLHEPGVIAFAHDRINEAFYANLEESERKIVHLSIANAMERDSSETLADNFFDLAYHVIEGGDMDRALILSYPAGLKALNEYANEDALKYFIIALDLLEEAGFSETRQWVEIQKSISRVYLNMGKYDDAIAILLKILPHLVSKTEKVEVYSYICNAYFKKAEWGNCEKYSMMAYRATGNKFYQHKPLIILAIGLSRNRALIVLAIIKEFIIHLVHSMFTGYYYRKKEIRDPVWPILGKNAMSLIWSYLFSDMLKFIWAIFAALNLAEKHIGKSPELGMALGGYGSLLMAIPFFKKAISVHKQALSLRKELNDTWGAAQSLQWLAFCYQWKGEFKKSIECFNESASIFQEIGDIWEYAFSIFGLVNSQFYLSDWEGARENTEEYFKIFSKSSDNFGMSMYWLLYARYTLAVGDYSSAESYGLICHDVSKKARVWYVFCLSNIILGEIYLEKGDFQQSLIFLEAAKELFEKKVFLKAYMIQLYPLYAEASLADCRTSIELTKSQKRKYLRAIHGQCKKALRKTRPWIVYHGMSYLVNAKYYALEGKRDKAERFFLRCIDLNKRIDNRYHLAQGYYEYGLYLYQADNPRAARESLESAYQIFSDLKSEKYVERIRNLLGTKDSTTVPASLERLIDNERMSSVIRLAREISRITDFDTLINETLARAVEITGAQRGCIFLANEKNELDKKAFLSTGSSNMMISTYLMKIIETVFVTGSPVLLKDTSEDNNFKDKDGNPGDETKSVLSLPIMERERIIGVCHLDNSLTSGVFGRVEMDIVNLFLSNISYARAMDILERRDDNKSGRERRVVEMPIPAEKIQKAIDYINDNYMSEISREGLASHVGMHYDNLGKYFKKFLGKKMNDYINELRVKEAVRRLSETPDRIIDIAFSVGFGSISTFNKVFRHIMNVSPAVYRKNINK